MPSASFYESRRHRRSRLSASERTQPFIPTVHASLHKNRFAKLLEKSMSEEFSLIIDNQSVTRWRFYKFSHSAKLLYTNFVNEDNRFYLMKNKNLRNFYYEQPMNSVSLHAFSIS